MCYRCVLVKLLMQNKWGKILSSILCCQKETTVVTWRKKNLDKNDRTRNCF